MKWRYAAPPLVLVVVLVAITPVVRPAFTHWWWQRQSGLPLDEAQSAALETCADPGWAGYLRVLHQDLDVDCTPSQLGAMGATHLEGRMRQEWVRALAEDETSTPRTRLRAGLALLESGQPPVRGLSLLITHPMVPVEDRTEVVRQLVSGDLDGTWADPLLWGEVSAWRLAEGELDAAPTVIQRLRVESLDAGLDLDTRVWLARVALDAAGYPEWVVRRHTERRDLDLPEQLPHDVARDAEVIDHACAEAHTPDCLRVAAELLERTSSSEPHLLDGPPPAAGGVAAPLWSLLYDGDEESVYVATELVAAVAAWVARAPQGDRGWRLLGAVTARPADPPALRPDPVQAILHRRAGPWTTALAALAVAEVAGAEVSAEPWEEGVLLRADGLVVYIDTCGGRHAPALDSEVPPAPWPTRAVVAQAAAEAALHPAEQTRALVLAHLAQRADSTGTQGLLERVMGDGAGEDSPEALLGRRAGNLLSVAAPTPPAGAEAARSAMARSWYTPACD